MRRIFAFLWQFMPFSFLVSFSLLFLRIPSCLEIPIHRQRKQRSRKEAEKERYNSGQLDSQQVLNHIWILTNIILLRWFFIIFIVIFQKNWLAGNSLIYIYSIGLRIVPKTSLLSYTYKKYRYYYSSVLRIRIRPLVCTDN